MLTPEEINAQISEMKDFISVMGMFEQKREDFSYIPRNTSINKNHSDWKSYPTQVVKNKYGL